VTLEIVMPATVVKIRKDTGIPFPAGSDWKEILFP